MKIGFDAKRLYKNGAGLGNYSRTLVHNLSEFFPQHAYYLYSPQGTPVTAARPFVGNPRYQQRLRKGPMKSLWRSYGMVKQLRQDGIDVYHGLSHELPVGLERSSIAQVVTIHDLIFRRYPHTYPTFDRHIYDLKFSYACQRAQRIIAISESTRQDVMEYYGTDPAKISVVYQSCQPEFFEAPQPRQASAIFAEYGIPEHYMLSVGTLEARKNLHRVAEAYAHLPASLHLPWVIVGRATPYKRHIWGMLQKVAPKVPIIWLENLHSTPALKALYDHATALVYPSLYEGFGLPVAEALLCRTPVVTSHTSSLPEAGGPHSIYVDPTQPEDIADGLQRVLTDTEGNERRREEGRTYAEDHFSARTTSEALMGVYNSVKS